MVFYMASLRRTQLKRLRTHTQFMCPTFTPATTADTSVQHLTSRRHWNHHRIMWQCIIPNPFSRPGLLVGILPSNSSVSRQNTFHHSKRYHSYDLFVWLLLSACNYVVVWYQADTLRERERECMSGTQAINTFS